MVKIVILTPVVEEPSLAIQKLQEFVGPDVELVERCLTSGPRSIETMQDSLEAAVGVVDLAVEAEKGGADGIVINCMADPGLLETREVVSVPVVGAGQAAIELAYGLGGQVGWLDVVSSARIEVARQFDLYGYTDRYCGFDALDIPVLALNEDAEKTVQAAAQSITDMVFKVGADAVVLGCTELTFLQQAIQFQVNEFLHKHGRSVQAIPGLPVAIARASFLARAGFRPL